jgi:hypothetical protein
MTDDTDDGRTDEPLRTDWSLVADRGPGRRDVLKTLGLACLTGGTIGQFSSPTRATRGHPRRGVSGLFRWVWAEQSKLVDGRGDRRDRFGTSVAVDGDTAVVGAPIDEDAGSVAVFRLRNGQWVETATLTANDGRDDDGLGRSVAVDGTTVLAGAPGTDRPNGSDSGAAYVFTRSGGRWSQAAKLVPTDGDRDDAFGWSVALDGSTALVGAHGDEDPYGKLGGAAYAFTRAGGRWSQQAKLTANDGDSGDTFGWSVAVDGDTALVGAYDDEDPNGGDAGSAYAFTRSNGQWTQQAKLLPTDGDSGDWFGWAVALDGETGLVGAPGDEDPNGRSAGSAYVFTRSNGQWAQETKLVASDGANTDIFGWSAALEDSTALVGAAADANPNGNAVGSAYLFTRAGGGWPEQAKLTAPDGDPDDWFGSSVAIDSGNRFPLDETALVGAPLDEDPNGADAGSAYVFGQTFRYPIFLPDPTDVPDELFAVVVPRTEAFAPTDHLVVESLRFVHPDLVAEYGRYPDLAAADAGAEPVDIQVTDATDDGAADLLVRFRTASVPLDGAERAEGVLVGKTKTGQTLVGKTEVED